METFTAKQEADMITDLMDYAERVLDNGGMSPAAWKRARRLCRLLNVTFDEVLDEALEGLR